MRDVDLLQMTTKELKVEGLPNCSAPVKSSQADISIMLHQEGIDCFKFSMSGCLHAKAQHLI